MAAAEDLTIPSAEDAPLYAERAKVYPKRVRGLFRRIKWAALIVLLGIYYVAPWLRWDRGPGAPDQAFLVDMPARRAYFLGIEIWPQEVYYLTGLLILGAVGLFLVTSVAGRVWCGFACPQTVWTDLFMWVEHLIEGDRNARIKLDRQSWTVRKYARKALKHGAWLAIAALTGGAWVMYFNDAPTLVRDLARLEASTTVLFFIGLFTTTTYLLAGLAREQLCTYMCPWPRFQAAMLDEDTLVVTYEGWRGEPRGKHRKGPQADRLGDCVDCGQCFHVCPTGVDIRDGNQLECIGCALCIDACNEVMAKVGLPRDLITYDTTRNQAQRAAGRPTGYRLLRPRTVIYAGLLAAAGLVMIAALAMRSTLDINVLRDRSPLFVTLSDGSIRNGYTFKILNKSRVERDFELGFDGPAGAELAVVGIERSQGPARFHARRDTVETYRLYVKAPRQALPEATVPVRFLLRDLSDGESAAYDSVFVGPGR
jgi:cytochrome c oxidase accessory protein FixG